MIAFIVHKLFLITITHCKHKTSTTITATTTTKTTTTTTTIVTTTTVTTTIVTTTIIIIILILKKENNLIVEYIVNYLRKIMSILLPAIVAPIVHPATIAIMMQ